MAIRIAEVGLGCARDDGDQRAQACLRHLKIPSPPGRHRAMADVQVTAEVFIAMATAADWTDLRQLREVAGYAAQAAQPEQISFFG